MAWCPFAVYRPLSENHLQGGITPRAIILHTAVSSSPSLYDFFQNNSNLESHFYVADNGTIEQYMDTQIMADANKNANGFAVSIESQDGATIRPWTQAQLDSIVRLCDWLCTTHGIPRRQIPAWDSSGIGWHVMFGAPGPWTPVSKSCPGQPRIDQTRNTVIPRVAAGQIGAEDMYEERDRTTLNALAYRVKAFLDAADKVGVDAWPASIRGEVQTTTVNLKALAGRVEALINNNPTVTYGPKAGEVNALHGEIESIQLGQAILSAKLDGIQLAGVDYELLADKVAERLAQRLAD